MKKIMMLLLAFALATGANAQGKSKDHERKHDHKKMNPEEAARKQADHLEKALTLDASQKESVKASALSRIQKVHSIREKYGKEGDKKAMHAEVREVNNAFIAEVNAKLNKEQQQKWEEMRKKRKEEMKKRKDEKKPKAPEPPDDDNEIDID